MSFGEFMGLAVLVAGFIAIAEIAMKAYRARLHLREREVELKIIQASQPRAADSGDGRIEQRLRVLERIATDKGPNLAAEIEQLRDKRTLHREDV